MALLAEGAERLVVTTPLELEVLAEAMAQELAKPLEMELPQALIPVLAAAVLLAPTLPRTQEVTAVQVTHELRIGVNDG